MTPPLVSFVTPTRGRPELHPQLFSGFDADRWPNKELVVFDESDAPSPFFSTLKDSRVRYVHAPGAFKPDGVTRIGAVRNHMLGLASGQFIEHRDDDDWYSPAYTNFMMARLGNAALAKLDVYKCLHEASGQLFGWDTRHFGGTHYALLGDSVEKVHVGPDEMPPEMRDAMHIGYGFSLIGPRETFEQFPFPEEGTEDIPFVRSVRAAGKEIVFVSDGSSLCIHLVSARSTSGVYPQKMIGNPSSSREQLPAGQAVRVEPGKTYEVIASVKKKHSLKDLTVRCESWGLHVDEAQDNVKGLSFGVAPARGDYRLVHVIGHADKEISIPWKVPAPLSIFDGSAIVKAWVILPTRDAMVGNPQSVGIEAAKKLGVPVRRKAWGGAPDTLKEMAHFIREGGRSPLMKQFAEMVVTQAGVPRSQNLSTKDAAQILLDYVHNNARYREDPDNVESVQSAAITLCVPGAQICIPVGDCDDLVVAYASLLIAYGVRGVHILVQDYGDGGDLHVLVAMSASLADGTPTKDVLVADPSLKGAPVGQKRSAQKEYEVDPLSDDLNPGASEPEFVGIGRPRASTAIVLSKSCKRMVAGGSCCSSCSSGAGACEDDVKLSLKDLWQRAMIAGPSPSGGTGLSTGAKVAIGMAAAAAVVGGVYVAVKTLDNGLPQSTREMLEAGEGQTTFKLESRGIGPTSKSHGYRVYRVKHNGRVIGRVRRDIDLGGWSYAVRGSDSWASVEGRSRDAAAGMLIATIVGR